MMSVLYMARHYLKRMIRNRIVAITALAVPLVCGIGCVAAPGPGIASVYRWICFLVCLAVAGGWVMTLREADKASGLADALRNTPVSDAQLLAARAAAGAVVFAVQASILVAILAAAL